MWASVGKSRSWTVFDKRRDKANYKRAVRYTEKSRANEFSDSLNDALWIGFGSPGDQSFVLNILLCWLMACGM